MARQPAELFPTCPRLLAKPTFALLKGYSSIGQILVSDAPAYFLNAGGAFVVLHLTRQGFPHHHQLCDG